MNRHTLALMLVCATAAQAQRITPTDSARESAAIRALLDTFYDGWNARDADRMVSVYADDVDHVNVFGEWRRGREFLRPEIREFLGGRGRTGDKTYTLEKLRFVKPDVAVAHVRSLSAVGNIGTYVLAKDAGRWLVVSFTNVGYELAPGRAAQPPVVAAASAPVAVPGGCETARTGAADAVGCHLAGTEPLGPAPATPLYWHVDRYATRAAAESAKGARGTVAVAHGGAWLFTLADSAWHPASGERVARVGPLPVTPGRRYTAHYFEAVVPPGAATPVHRHPGPEAWLVLGGTQCLETPDGARLVRAGESFVVPEGPPMLLAGAGTVTRRTLGLVLHDAARPWTTPAADWTPSGACLR